MQLEFVNHASVIYSHGDVRLIADPWIEGTVFQNAWAHLTKTKFSYDDFGRITHIWFSHEHPDHFFPPNVKKIPAEHRANITLLYKRTIDKKVIGFCKSQGFKEIIELPIDDWHQLTDDIRLLCHTCHDDTTLVFDNGEHTIVNTNDCVLRKDNRIEKLKAIIGQEVDVLLTQFSYASYVGETYEQRRRHALEKMGQISHQIDGLGPKFWIPFASFVYFCHEDNFYMNDAINRIDHVYDHFASRTDVQTIVLYPGETWGVGQQHDSSSSVQKYVGDHDSIEGPLVFTQPVDKETLHVTASEFHERIKKKVAYLSFLKLTGVVKPLRVYVTDHQAAYQLGIAQFDDLPDVNKSDCGMSMSSETLNFCMKFDFGFNTTAVNGKFHVLSPAGHKSFQTFTSLGDAMNHGRVTWGQLIKGIGRRVARRLKLASSEA